MTPSRGRIFVLAVVGCVLIGVTVMAGALGAESGGPPAADPARIAAARAKPHVFVRQTAGSGAEGRVAILPRDGAAGAADPVLTGLNCERFYFAADRGVCLGAQPGFFGTFAATLVDANLQALATVPLAGVPSRARISRDGRYAALTAFVSGHTYAGTGFSTQTLIVDATTGAIVVDLEADLQLTRDGAVIDAPDINYWGVTFTDDSNTFYATVGTRGSRYLVLGNVAERSAVILGVNIECPSLSPDGQKIAFKKQVRNFEAIEILGRPFVWQVSILTLADMSVQVLGDTRDIDDQVEWLDDDNVVYAYSDPASGLTSVWRAPLDGGAPTLYTANAESPAVVASSSMIATPSDATANQPAVDAEPAAAVGNGDDQQR